MAENKKEDITPSPITTPPQGAKKTLTLKLQNKSLKYEAIADWLILRKKQKPLAEMFYVYYRGEKENESRPITFVFNGGPGAAAAYLHMGALGPMRVCFEESGHPSAAADSLTENQESWLDFTDLVFIDPVGTGFSRPLDEKEKKEDPGSKSSSTEDNKEFYDIERDIESLGEFISQFLSIHHRWASPTYIAGESYGGYRVGRLSRKLQEDYGVGLEGAILISPAIEMSDLSGTDYDLLKWLDGFPTFVAAATHHGLSRTFGKEDSMERVLLEAEHFCGNELCRLLVQGASMPEETRDAIIAQMAGMLGLEEELLKTAIGRIDNIRFSRELLRAQGKVLGLYDASVTGLDPYPDREQRQGPDPTLGGLTSLFTRGVNRQLRQTLGIKSDRDYKLLSMEVHSSWNFGKRRLGSNELGAADDLRYAMTLNPSLRVSIVHGYLDMVTPYYSSKRIFNQMKLHSDVAHNISLKNYFGGHMFYSWDESRKAFTDDMRQFYNKAVNQ